MRLFSFSLIVMLTYLLLGAPTPKPQNLSPVGTAHSATWNTKESATKIQFDFYVSPKGSDTAAGTQRAPFKTLQKARDALRKTKKGGSVGLMSGTYYVDSFVLQKQDSNSTYMPVSSDAEVTISNGKVLSAGSFAPVKSAKVLARLSPEARKKVRVADLKAKGLTPKDWGGMTAVGWSNHAWRYPNAQVGAMYSELFAAGKRCTLARYPNTGWARTGKILQGGEGIDWNKGLPPTQIFQADDATAARLANYASTADVWMRGYWNPDWADCSTLLDRYDPAAKSIALRYASNYGIAENKPYFIYNALEELDSPGEYYIDRTQGLVYYWPAPGATYAAELSLSTKPVVQITANNVTLRGLQLRGSRGDALLVSGNKNTITECKLYNVGGNAAVLEQGDNNRFSQCEVTHTGRGGILIMGGGDRNTLRAGNNLVENCLVHDWSEVYLTYQPGVYLAGTGNRAAHNELFNAPHQAIGYAGNNHIMEYNKIHDVSLNSDDHGAIYAGRRWDWYGNVIRYNCIYNTGSPQNDLYADGIYVDDDLSGIQVYGGLLVNIPKYWIQLGGGRDLNVRNNLLINCGMPIRYDERARYGAMHEGAWFWLQAGPNGEIWRNLYDSPWKTETWQKAYPGMARISDDFSNPEDPNFGPNPAYSVVEGNLIFHKKLLFGSSVPESVNRFSSIKNNPIWLPAAAPAFFVDYENGDFRLKQSVAQLLKTTMGWEDLPVAAMGRQAW